MATKDLLQRFIFETAPVRGEYVTLHDSFLTIVSQHRYPAPIRRILGEALCAASLMTAIIKFDGRLTIQFRGKGKLKLLLAQCNNEFHLRGLVKWDGELTYEELLESFKQGVLVITLDSGEKGRYQGIVNWRGHSLADSLEGYFKDSEQLLTKMWLAVDESTAAGFLLQVVPSSDKTMTGIEKEIIEPHWARISSHTDSQLSRDFLLRTDGEALLTTLYPHEDVRVFPSTAVSFHCECTRKRGEDAIALLGKEEAEEELVNHNTIVVTCDFCNKEYVFDRVDVAAIFEGRKRPPSDSHLH